MSEVIINDKITLNLSADEIKAIFNIHQKLQKRLHRHGSIDIVKKKGRPKVSPDHKKEMYYKRQEKYKLQKLEKLTLTSSQTKSMKNLSISV